MEYVIKFIKTLSLQVFFVLDIGYENSPAIFIAAHFFQKLLAIHLNNDSRVRSANNSGAVWTVKEYVIITENLSLTQKCKFEYFNISLQLAQNNFALLIFPVNLCLFHMFDRVFRSAVPLILIVELLAKHFPASFCHFIWVVGIVIEW